ncbi:MAG TPA: hypothetical protein VF580_10630 [Thermoanaerobaculia bacterium]|jgi:hypothetical protein
MDRTSQRTHEGLALAQGFSGYARLRWPFLLVAEGLILAVAASSVTIPPLVAQLFRALLTF